MIRRITGLTVRRIGTALVVLALLLSVYIMAGRYLVAQAPQWTGSIEQMLAEAAGMPVSIGGLQGEWRGFSPVLHVRDVALLTPGGQSAMELSRMELTLDIPRSLLALRWMAGRIRVRNLDLNVEQHEEGGWRLVGGPAAGAQLGPDAVFDILTRFADVELLDARITARNLHGEQLSLDALALRFQSRAGRHRLRAEAWLAGDPRRIRLQAELQGRRLDGLDGGIYLDLPPNDLGALLRQWQQQHLELAGLRAGFELWLELRNGRMDGIDARVHEGSLSLRDRIRDRTVTVDGLTGLLQLRRDDERWEFWTRDLGFRLNNDTWPASAMYASWVPSGELQLRADRFNTGLATTLIRELRLAPSRALDELSTLNPRGELQELDVYAGLESDTLTALSLRGNLQDVRVDARGMAPALWGISGYTELDYSSDSGQLSGRVDVDARDVGVHLPRLFPDAWHYERVNGRVNVHLDLREGVALRISSSVITAESDVISGRVQFGVTLRQPTEGEDHAAFELLVGALRGDAAAKSAYLPTGPGAPPGAQGVLAWVDESVLGGQVGGSGFLFRGSVLPDAAPEERTLQMFYRVEDGVLRFDPAWPALEQVDGLVVVDREDVDVSVTDGSSLGIDFSETRAEVRANPEGAGRWLTVTGEGQGPARQGLAYLQQTPVTAGLGEYAANWEAAGEVGFSLELELPLFIEDAGPRISLALDIDQGHVVIPDYQLTLADIDGEFLYDNRQGLSSEALRARLLDEPVSVDIASAGWPDGVNDVTLTVEGEVATGQLMGWGLLPDLVTRMGDAMDGRLQYTARLLLPERDERNLEPRLHLQSDLQGVVLDIPEPLHKSAQQRMPLDMTLLFGNDERRMQLRLGDLASVNTRFDASGVRAGLVFLGPPGEDVQVRRFNEGAPGLDVLGRIPVFDVQSWIDFQDRHGVPAQELTGEARSVLNMVDVNIDELLVFDEKFNNVNVQFRDDAGQRSLLLESDNLAGTLRLPASAAAPLQADFDRLYVGGPPPGETAEQVSPPAEGSGTEGEVSLAQLDTVEYTMPPSDPLADVDPRTFPSLELSVDDLRVDGAEYGSWAFELQPREDGARFVDLQVASRGLRVGDAGAEAEEENGGASLLWTYDGQTHYSEFSGNIHADNLGPVLSAYGYAPVLESSSARFDVALEWEGSPAFLSAVGVSGEVDIALDDGRFRSGTGAANSALKLISIINFDALIRRLRFSDDLLREGLSYEEIRGSVTLDDGVVTIQDRLQIIGPSSLFQVSGEVNLREQTVDGSLYITLPVSENLPWVSGIAAFTNLINWQVAVGVFVLDQIFGDQVDSLTSAQYTLEGSWDTLEPRLNQVFTTGGNEQ